MELTIDLIGGMCPMQASGLVDGQFWYFRARGSRWSFEVWPPGSVEDGPGDLPLNDPEWCVGRQWKACRTGEADPEFGAGYMPQEDAEAYIQECAVAWRAWADAGKP